MRIHRRERRERRDEEEFLSALSASLTINFCAAFVDLGVDG
jgi:hypothetical protein